MIMLVVVVLLTSLVTSSFAQSTYIIGPQGISCSDACHAKGMNCNPHIVTNNSTSLFTSLGINCTPDPTPWWAEDQPSYVSNSSDPNYGKCVGYMGVPSGVFCGGTYPTTSRLCACDDPNSASSVAAFGTGYSGGYVSEVEMTIFNHIVPTGTYGVMTHFWVTGTDAALNGTMIRYYVDDETTASIQFIPSMACGVGFDDQHNPWGTNWFGKGAAGGAWFNNFRIPFQRSIKVTTQHPSGIQGGFYIIVRGLPNLPITLGGVAIPSTAKMNLFVFDQVVSPVEWVTVADVPSGSGLFWMHTIAVQSGNLNFLEGCYHLYSPYNQTFPGTLLSTGTEDYFDSAWYFNGGQFWLPVSGFTHINTTGDQVTWSAYRFHEMDPLPFDSGLKLMWRNGDVLDPAGLKCFVEGTDGTIAGSPTNSHVTIYAWVYTW